MKGLLRNHFYATNSNAKIFAVFMLLFGAFAVAVISQGIQFSFLLCTILGFSFHAADIVKNESASKWGKYKLTLPVKRSDIVRSLYLNFIIWMLVGTLFAGAETALSWLAHGCPFDFPIDTLTLFALGISMSLFMGAIFFPLTFLGGEEKGDAFSIVSLLCAIGLNIAIVNLCNLVFLPSPATIVLCDLILVGSAALAFLLSYFMAVGIFRRKEY